MIVDLKTIENHGMLKEDENYEFRSFLKMQDSKKVDKIVKELTKFYTNKIDCQKCANCCIVFQTLVSEEDINRFASKLNIPIENFMNDFIETDDYGDYLLKHKPCIFLKENKCTIYHEKPSDCASFPHLHKNNFNSRLLGVISNYSICPIVYNVYEDLKNHFNFKRRKKHY